MEGCHSPSTPKKDGVGVAPPPTPIKLRNVGPGRSGVPPRLDHALCCGLANCNTVLSALLCTPARGARAASAGLVTRALKEAMALQWVDRHLKGV